MRVLNARFALGLGLFTVVFAMADTAQAGPFARLRARRAGMVYTSYGYGGVAYDGVAYDGYGQPMYGAVSYDGYGQPVYGATSSPCPCSSNTISYGGSSTYYPSGTYYGSTYGGTYGGAMPMPGAGGTTSYYPPGTITPSPMPGGTVPTPLPSPDTVARGDATVKGEAAVKTIEISDTAFEPKSLTIEPGTTVKWTNKGQKPHTVTSDKGDWGSNELANGEMFSATFTKAGTFDYHCKGNPDMKATIIVK